MYIYLDTMMWNKLCDQNVDPRELVTSLNAKGTHLLLSTQTMYELAKTFLANPDRGKVLFSYLQAFVDMHIPCTNETARILHEEAVCALNGCTSIDFYLTSDSYRRMEIEILKLSQGTFEALPDSFIAWRKQEAARAKNAVETLYQSNSELKAKLSAIPLNYLEKWLSEEVTKSGRKLLKAHLLREISDTSSRQASILAKKLLRLPRYRLSHALVRADLYVNWRCAQYHLIAADIPDDLYHLVNAAHSDVYVTNENRQSKYFSLILTKGRVALYKDGVSVAPWLLALA